MASHIRTIGESYRIGGATASDSYLRADTVVIAAAKAAGAEAIHPGLAFWRETSVAQAVEAAGLAFIGPTPDVIERLGDKASAKREAASSGRADRARTARPRATTRPLSPGSCATSACR